ncbi:MAG: cyclic nucleotide-binding domain-containing protein [Isosphaeraceae bacterium]|nr:cyclic nucleotide-binding domain-containing protein [Isosphaeraceae bacterium]
MIDDDAAQRFMTAPQFAGTDPASLRALLNTLVEDRAPAGAVLLEQNQPNDHLSILIGGTATIERTFPDRPKEVLATLNAPALFGTTSFFRPSPPTVTVRAISEAWLLTLYHPAHDKLRAENPRAAEALLLAVVRVLAERFDLVDKRVSDYLFAHADDHPKVNEWSGFRARLFEEPAIE